MKPYIPQKMPIRLETETLLSLNKKLIKAHKLINEFEIRISKNNINKYLLYLFTTKESLQSTKIEGTQSTLSDVLESSLTNIINDDVMEIKNYLDALNLGIEKLNDLPISNRLIKEIHKEMLKTGRGSNSNIGHYRKIQNWIGGTKIENATFIPPEPQLIEEYMSNLEKYINEEDNLMDELIKIAIIHGQFETIHPFLDGNGRVGRILINIYLYSKGVIKNKNFYISEEIERHKLKYYHYLNGIRNQDKNWIEWINFFIDCVINQAKRNIEKLKEVEELYEYVLEIMKKERIKYEFIEYIFKNPVFNMKKIMKDTKLKYTSVRNNINKLTKSKVIFSDDKSRNKTYYFLDLIDKFNK